MQASSTITETQLMIDCLISGVAGMKESIYNGINDGDPFYLLLYTEENKADAYEFTLALYDGNETLARRMTETYINKFQLQ